MELIFTAALALHLLAPPSAMPVQYTATSPQVAGSLTFAPARGTWVSTSECFWGCYVAAGVPVQLLQGEVDVEALASLEVTIRRDGVPVVDCFRFYGGVPVCMPSGN